MTDTDIGNERIREAIAASQPPVFFVESLRQFGDVLHSTLVVRHLRVTRPDASVVWAISERYAPAFWTFVPAEFGPHFIVRLPHGPSFPEDAQLRIAWVRRAAELPGVERSIGCGVHPWGWISGSLVDAVLHNAGIGALAVQRRPWLPLDISDYAWNDDFQRRHALLDGYVALEHVSYSLGNADVAWYADIVRRIRLPVVALGGSADPPVAGTIDGHGCTFGQAKATIMRARCFVGCGSGLSVLAATDGCMCPVIELIDEPLSMPGLGYLAVGRRHACVPTRDPSEVAAAINRMLG